SHTKFSGYVCALISAKTKLGLTLNHRDRPQFGGPWFKFLNDVAASGGQTGFHFTDVFYLGSGLPRGLQSVAGAKISMPQNGLLLLQPLTSDKKKNYGAANWTETLYHFHL